MQLFHDTVDYLCCWQNLERPVPFSPNDAGFLIWSNILSMSVKWVVFRALMLNFVFHSFIIPNQNMRNVLSPVILLCSRHMYPVNMGVFILKEGVIWMPVFSFHVSNVIPVLSVLQSRLVPDEQKGYILRWKVKLHLFFRFFLLHFLVCFDTDEMQIHTHRKW